MGYNIICSEKEKRETEKSLLSIVFIPIASAPLWWLAGYFHLKPAVFLLPCVLETIQASPLHGKSPQSYPKRDEIITLYLIQQDRGH